MELGTGSSVNSGSKCLRSLGPLYSRKEKSHSVKKSHCIQGKEILMWALNSGAQVFRAQYGNFHNNLPFQAQNPEASLSLSDEDGPFFIFWYFH